MTDYERKEIVRLYKNTLMSPAEIAKRMWMSPSVIHCVINAEFTANERKERQGRAKEYKKRQTRDRNARIVEMYRAGMSRRQIAFSCGLNEWRVKEILADNMSQEERFDIARDRVGKPYPKGGRPL